MSSSSLDVCFFFSRFNAVSDSALVIKLLVWFQDEEGQNVMAALRSSFEAAFAFVSSMDENNKK